MNDEFTKEQMDLWESLDISDSFIFYRVMRNSPERCMKLLQRILPELHIKHIEFVESEKYVKESPDSRGVRLDAFAGDDKCRVYNIEMQVRNVDDLPRRSRYYQALTDNSLLEKNEDYRNINDSYVIFICRFDLFDAGYYRYTFRNICLEDYAIELNDGTEKVFLNPYGVKGDISRELKAFLDMVKGIHDEDDFVKELDEAISEVKMDALARREYMIMKADRRIDRDIAKQEGRAEGIAEGLAKGRLEGGIRCFYEMKRDEGYEETQIIAEAEKRFGMPQEEIRRIIREG